MINELNRIKAELLLQMFNEQYEAMIKPDLKTIYYPSYESAYAAIKIVYNVLHNIFDDYNISSYAFNYGFLVAQEELKEIYGIDIKKGEKK